ncbi:MAG: TRAP transporter small permease subunit [Paracoccaceae bacterium]
MEFLIWLFTQVGIGFVNIAYGLINIPGFLKALIGIWDLSSLEEKQQLIRFIYFGGHNAFFFVVMDIFLVITVIGIFRNNFLWAVVRILEGCMNGIGRLAAWAGLLMVLQQIMVVFLQRIFLVPGISIGPFGYTFYRDLSWYSEELKFYNAMVVGLCASYTFVQGGHVRVDLFYAGAKFRTKRIVDMFGSLFFILPSMTLVWFYGWFFLWRGLVTPKIAAANTLDLLEKKARILKWNVETIAFSLNGFDAYFLFKILLISFAGLMFVQGWTFFFRSYLEFKEGPESEGKYVDKDIMGDEDAEDLAAEEMHVGAAE